MLAGGIIPGAGIIPGGGIMPMFIGIGGRFIIDPIGGRLGNPIIIPGGPDMPGGIIGGNISGMNPCGGPWSIPGMLLGSKFPRKPGCCCCSMVGPALKSIGLMKWSIGGPWSILPKPSNAFRGICIASNIVGTFGRSFRFGITTASSSAIASSSLCSLSYSSLIPIFSGLTDGGLIPWI